MSRYDPLARLYDIERLQLDDDDDEDTFMGSPTPMAARLPPVLVTPSILGLNIAARASSPVFRPRSSSFPTSSDIDTLDDIPRPDPFSTPKRPLISTNIFGINSPNDGLRTPSSRTRSSSLPDPHTPAAKLRRIQGAQKRLAKLGLKPRGKKDTPTPAEVKAAYEDLKSKGIPMGSLVDYFFDPSSGLRTAHWDEFFKVKGRATQLLNWWVTSNSQTAKEEVREWAIGFVAGQVAKEAEAVNRSGLLRSKKEFDTDEVMGFSFQTLYGKLKDTHASISMRVLGAMSKSARQIKDGLSKFRLMNKQVIIVSAYSACMSEFSRCNNLLKRFFGLYLYATGAQRQVLTVLSHVGMSESYSNLTAKISNTRKTPGTVVRLSQFLRGLTRKLGATGLFALVYDNINFSDKIAEQVVGRSTAVESGTCSTIWPLHKASLDDMKIEDFNEAFDKAKPLELSDIVHTPEERKALNESLIHCILRIIVRHGGEELQRKFGKALKDSEPTTEHQIETHETPLHPLPSWKIDESTIVGNAEVDAAIVDELKLRDQPSIWMKYVRFIAGDQLSIARLRSLASLRAGHEGGYSGFGWGVWMPGLFHAKMADMHGFFVTHFGKPNAGTRNPGCLGFHNTLLRHLPISLTSLPTFRTCRDLVFVSLYARVLHCLLLVSGHSSLEEYCASVNDWDTLKRHAEQIFTRFANARTVDALRRERAKSGGGDMVLENAILFLRDALMSRELTDAVKKGDSGRVMLVLKGLALSFRGNGRTKYAYEMMLLIHNIQKVWPKKIADIVLQNWLLNPTNKDNAFVEADLVQEHMNYWIKVFYKAHGPNTTWDWLEMISPCVYALRHLANAMKKVLGTDLGTRHAPVDLTIDIKVLMHSLKDHQVYEKVSGRILDKDDKPVTDVVAEGFRSLSQGTALNDYNHTFTKLQERRRMKPLVGGDATHGSSDVENSQNIQIPASSTPSTSNATEAVSSSPFTDDDLGSSPNDDQEANTTEDTQDEPTKVLEEDDETLALSTAEDVAFDMDTQEMEEEEDVEDDEDDEIGLEDVLMS